MLFHIPILIGFVQQVVALTSLYAVGVPCFVQLFGNGHAFKLLELGEVPLAGVSNSAYFLVIDGFEHPLNMDVRIWCIPNVYNAVVVILQPLLFYRNNREF
jgi:hypothetical protein